jgi:hypothetical protein
MIHCVVIEMENFMTSETIKQAEEVSTNNDLATEMVETNHTLANRFFSYEVLEQILTTPLMNFFGRNS